MSIHISPVVQLYRRPLFLRGFDDDIRNSLAKEMREQGIDLRFDTDVECIERHDDGLLVRTNSGQCLHADHVLYATGRRPNTAGLGLEGVGVELDDRGTVLVDQYSRTSAANTYAVDDRADRRNLNPLASEEAMALIDMLYSFSCIIVPPRKRRRVATCHDPPTRSFLPPLRSSLLPLYRWARQSPCEIPGC